jgi:septum formation topological specificity factor MinE
MTSVRDKATTNDILEVLAKHFPFPSSDIRAAYETLECSVDRTITACNVAMMGVVGDLLEVAVKLKRLDSERQENVARFVEIDDNIIRISIDKDGNVLDAKNLGKIIHTSQSKTDWELIYK